MSLSALGLSATVPEASTAKPLSAINRVTAVNNPVADYPNFSDISDTVDVVEIDVVEPSHYFKKVNSETMRGIRQKVHFTWGADAGGSVDLSHNDMSAMCFAAYFGMRYRMFDIIGVGAGVDIMISNSGRQFPLFGIVRTSFSSSPKILFLEARVGPSICYLENDHKETVVYGNVSLGFNLARNTKFDSYITVGYEITERKAQPDFGRKKSHIQGAVIRLGVAF